MKYIAWYGNRLLIELPDGRVYIDKTSGGWLDKWLFKKLPRENSQGQVIGIGPE